MPDVQLILLVGAYSQKYYLNGKRGPKAERNLTGDGTRVGVLPSEVPAARASFAPKL